MEVEADILPEWWRRQDAEARQGATARPPDPPGGPVGIALPGKSAVITPPDAPPFSCGGRGWVRFWVRSGW